MKLHTGFIIPVFTQLWRTAGTSWSNCENKSKECWLHHVPLAITSDGLLGGKNTPPWWRHFVYYFDLRVSRAMAGVYAKYEGNREKDNLTEPGRKDKTTQEPLARWGKIKADAGWGGEGNEELSFRNIKFWTVCRRDEWWCPVVMAYVSPRARTEM